MHVMNNKRCSYHLYHSGNFKTLLEALCQELGPRLNIYSLLHHDITESEDLVSNPEIYLLGSR